MQNRATFSVVSTRHKCAKALRLVAKDFGVIHNLEFQQISFRTWYLYCELEVKNA